MYKHLCNDNAARSMQRYGLSYVKIRLVIYKDTACHIQRYGSSYTKIQLIIYAKVAYFLKKSMFFP